MINAHLHLQSLSAFAGTLAARVQRGLPTEGGASTLPWTMATNLRRILP